MLVLHGTSLKSAELILREGWNVTQKNWTVSNTDVCYAIHPGLAYYPFEYLFVQSLRQGITSCLVQDTSLIPAVLVIDISLKRWCNDQTHSTPIELGSIQIIDKISAKDINGVYTIKGSLNRWKQNWLHIMNESKLFNKNPSVKVNTQHPKTCRFKVRTLMKQDPLVIPEQVNF